jgi:hypothetical protein
MRIRKSEFMDPDSVGQLITDPPDSDPPTSDPPYPDPQHWYTWLTLL